MFLSSLFLCSIDIASFFCDSREGLIKRNNIDIRIGIFLIVPEYYDLYKELEERFILVVPQNKQVENGSDNVLKCYGLIRGVLRGELMPET